MKKLPLTRLSEQPSFASVPRPPSSLQQPLSIANQLCPCLSERGSNDQNSVTSQNLRMAPKKGYDVASICIGIARLIGEAGKKTHILAEAQACLHVRPTYLSVVGRRCGRRNGRRTLLPSLRPDRPFLICGGGLDDCSTDDQGTRQQARLRDAPQILASTSPNVKCSLTLP